MVSGEGILLAAELPGTAPTALAALEVPMRPIIIAIAAGCFAHPTSGWCQDQPYPSEPTIFAPIVVGGLLGLVGVVGGAYLGYEVDKTCDNTGDFCLEPGFFLGAALVGTAGASIGAHVGNNGRGSVGKVFMYSILTWAAGIGGAAAVAAVNDNAGYAVLYALPAVQFAVTVAMERKLGRDNEARHRERTRLGLIAHPDRSGMYIGVQLAF